MIHTSQDYDLSVIKSEKFKNYGFRPKNNPSLSQSKSGDKSTNEIEYVPYRDESEMRDRCLTCFCTEGTLEFTALKCEDFGFDANASLINSVVGHF